MSYKIESCCAWGHLVSWCARSALTNFPCKLRLKIFLRPGGALGVQVHPLHPQATPMLTLSFHRQHIERASGLFRVDVNIGSERETSDKNSAIADMAAKCFAIRTFRCRVRCLSISDSETVTLPKSRFFRRHFCRPQYASNSNHCNIISS